MAGSRRLFLVVAVLVALLFGLPGVGAVQPASAQILVTAADPPAGEQGALNLSVKITGKGFKNGAKAKFLKTGTTDTAGVNVKSTQFVSSTQLIATVDIADAAALSLFDIQIANTDGRTGKGTELFSVVAKGRASLDVPLYVEFADVVGPSGTPAGWHSDGAGYVSDANNKSNLSVEITYVDLTDYDPVGAFTFGVSAASGRTVIFDFSRPVVDTSAPWCPERCPLPPAQAPPDFTADPIKSVSLFDTPQYSPPNYDFMTPAFCESVWSTEGWCPNDFRFSVETVGRKQYRFGFSPNLWRSLALPNTAAGMGVMAVAYDPATESWKLSNLRSWMIGGVVRQEPCPVTVERMQHVKGLVTWVFLGCYEMPFEMTLTRR